MSTTVPLLQQMSCGSKMVKDWKRVTGFVGKTALAKQALNMPQMTPRGTMTTEIHEQEGPN